MFIQKSKCELPILANVVDDQKVDTYNTFG